MSELSINPFTATAAIAHFEKESLPEPNVPVNTLAELLGERESQDQGTHTAIQSIFKTRKSREEQPKYEYITQIYPNPTCCLLKRQD